MPDSDLVNTTEIHRQQYAHFSKMNDLLYKLPVLFSTLIGGLWFFAFSEREESPGAAIIVLVFATILAFVFIKIMERFKSAFNAYINNLNRLDGIYRVSIKSTGTWSTIRWIQFSLWMAICGSLLLILIVGHTFIEMTCLSK